MKKLLLLFISLCYFFAPQAYSFYAQRDTIRQHITPEQAPDKLNALITITLTDADNTPLPKTKVTLTSPNAVYLSYTDAKGIVRFLIPKAETYAVGIDKSAEYYSLPVPDLPNVRQGVTLQYIPDDNIRPERPNDSKTTYDTLPAPPVNVYKIPEGHTLINVRILDLNENPVRNLELRMKSPAHAKIYTARTSTSGIAGFVVPSAQVCWLGMASISDIVAVDVPDASGARIEFTTYFQPTVVDEVIKNDTVTQRLTVNQHTTTERYMVNVLVRNWEHQPLADEAFSLRSARSGRVYFARTDAGGTCRLLVPKGELYFVSFEHDKDRDTLNYPVNADFTDYRLTYTYLGSKEIKRRILERAKVAAMLDSLDKVRRRTDSLYYISLTEEHFFEQLNWNDTAVVLERIKARVEKEKKYLSQNPLYYVEKGMEVAAVLHRNRDRWKNACIVTDVTGSMYGHLDDVVLWHEQEYSKGRKLQYLFFNDGDNHPDGPIGRNGGFYYSEGLTLRSVLATANTAMRAGYGGGSPENDIEALLFATKYLKPGSEMVLIADNNSDMYDISLLSQLRVPVHVILCGASYGPNEQYLLLAYRTGGSVHSIKEDLFDLRTKIVQNKLSFSGAQYRFDGSQFVKE